MVKKISVASHSDSRTANNEEEETYARLDDDEFFNNQQNPYDADFGDLLGENPDKTAHKANEMQPNSNNSNNAAASAFTLRTEKLPQGNYDTDVKFDFGAGAGVGGAGKDVEESIYDVMIDEREEKQMGYFANLVNLHKSSIDLKNFYSKLQNVFNQLTKKFSNHATNMANVCGDISALLSILEQEVKYLVSHRNKIFSKPFHGLFSGFKCFLEFELCYEFFLANFDEAQMQTSDIEEILDEEFGQNHDSLDCLLNEVYSQIMSFPILLEHVYAGASSLMDYSVRVEREEPIRLAIMFLNFKNLVFGLEGIKKSFKSSNTQKSLEIISKLDITRDAYKKGKIHSYLQYGQIHLVANAKAIFDSSNKMQKMIILIFTDILLIVKKKSSGYEAKLGIPMINMLKSEIASGQLKLTYYAGEENKTLIFEGDQIEAIRKTIFGDIIKETLKGTAFNVTVPLGTTCNLCKNFLGGFQAQAWFCQKKYFHKDCLLLPVPIETQMDVFYVAQMPQPTLNYEWKGKRSEITDLFIAPRAYKNEDGQIKIHKVMITKFNGKALQKVPFDGTIDEKFMAPILFRYQGTKAMLSFAPKFIEPFAEVSFFDSSSQGKKLSRIMSTVQVRESNPNLKRMTVASQKLNKTNDNMPQNVKSVPRQSVSAVQPQISNAPQTNQMHPSVMKSVSTPNLSRIQNRQSVLMPQPINNIQQAPYKPAISAPNLNINMARPSVVAHRASVRSPSQSMKFMPSTVSETKFSTLKSENSFTSIQPSQYESENEALIVQPPASAQTFSLVIRNKTYTFEKPEFMYSNFDRKAAENFLSHCDNGIFLMRLSIGDEGQPEAVVISVAQDRQVKHCKIFYMPYPRNYWSLRDGALNLPDLDSVVKFFRINNMKMVFSTMDVFLKSHLKFDGV